VEVQFRTHDLERCFESYREATRRWGPEVARRYIQRINLLLAARDFNELYHIRALRLHALTGGRTGQFAMTLQGRWRLIVVPNETGDVVRVEEVTNHYGD